MLAITRKSKNHAKKPQLSNTCRVYFGKSSKVNIINGGRREKFERTLARWDGQSQFASRLISDTLSLHHGFFKIFLSETTFLLESWIDKGVSGRAVQAYEISLEDQHSQRQFLWKKTPAAPFSRHADQQRFTPSRMVGVHRFRKWNFWAHWGAPFKKGQIPREPEAAGERQRASKPLVQKQSYEQPCFGFSHSSAWLHSSSRPCSIIPLANGGKRRIGDVQAAGAT